ncbi:MAG: Gfo/Idh/MocA family oxidoreductase [Phycisphaerae bacterium]|nr:Gfo/Idh/MocA family oxidoreductase [Phycisphaerae bacterium]
MKRREFIKSAAVTSAGLFLASCDGPTSYSSPVIAPRNIGANDKINVAQIGFGRIAHYDLGETMKNDGCRIVAVADVDINRAKEGKQWIEDKYKKKSGQENPVDVKVYQDYREMLQDKSIDAVIISTPDHWHAQPAMEAAIAGKDIYLQKPASLTIAEGRAMSDTVRGQKRILQIGSQQRASNPWPQFKQVCELVRNGRIGILSHVEVGLSTDPGCGNEPKMPVPANLDFDMWLGSTPLVDYTEKGVHPQKGYGRPGWLRIENYGAGMITGWGAHHLDTAHWGMGMEYSGPVEVEGEGEFPESGLWNVHGKFTTHAKYANGVTMEVSSRFKNGVKFIGTEGWLFVSRGNAKVTASDPSSGSSNKSALDASNPMILHSKIGDNEIKLYHSPEMHENWLDCIRSRQEPVAPVEVGHRSCSACLLSSIAMKLPGKLHWDPKKEKFIGNVAANAMLSRTQRGPYGTTKVKV